jgi:hypothetical protein
MGAHFFNLHPPTQETTALAVEECVTPDGDFPAIPLPCFGGFRCRADDPTKPGCLRTESFQRPSAQSGMVIGDHRLARGAPSLATFKEAQQWRRSR